MQFKPSTREQARLRFALVGPSGSGKTYTALKIATAIGDKVAVIDTERGSASKYGGGKPFTFDVLELTSHHPDRYVEAIAAAEKAGYDVLVIDSLSHAWQGKDGALETVDRAGRNSFSEGWRNVTPAHNRMVDAIIGASLHLIATMRVKTEYVIETDEKGRNVPRKVGLAPVQRQGMEYEFDVVADLDLDHNLTVTKTRCPTIDGMIVNKPGAPLAATLIEWLSDGEPVQYVTEHELADISDKITTLAGGDPAKTSKYHQRILAEFAVDSPARLKRDQAGQVLARLAAALEQQAIQELKDETKAEEVHA